MTIFIDRFKSIQRLKNRAFTLVEVLIAVAISMIVIGGISSAFLVFAKSTMSLANYADMNGQSRTFLERFGRDMRMAEKVWVATNERIAIDVPTTGGSETIDYIFDPDNKRVVRDVNAVQIPVLNNVEEFDVTYFNLQGNPTTALLEIKDVQLEARIMKTVLFIENTNQIVSARILMRNHTVSN